MTSARRSLTVVWALLFVGCKGDAKPKAKPTPVAGSGGALRETPSLDGLKGVIVTGTTVSFAGASVMAASMLITQRDTLTAAVRRAAPWDRPDPTMPDYAARGLALTFTPDAQADVVLAAMRAVLEAGATDIEILAQVDGKPAVICEAEYNPSMAPTPTDTDHVNLSVRIEPMQRLIGISRIDELHTFEPPYADFLSAIEHQKMSAFFQERQDVELAAAPGVTGTDLIPALRDVCKSFIGIQPRAVNELSAKFPADNQPQGSAP